MIVWIRLYLALDLEEFIAILVDHPTVLKETQVVSIDILRNVGIVQNWCKFAQGMLSDDDKVFDPKMKHFEMASYEERLDGTLHSLIREEASKCFQSNLDSQKFVLYSNFKGRYKIPTP
ncbi:unnamed protein product [Moneuplotes crassus]|uniref:Uncharacterized protein n=1 Tax=Euplotes crassus TaxID=5936 RepID=A0AAD1XU54_EUPCR|nr:unnamed protein product [Moneuplotes crassus]